MSWLLEFFSWFPNATWHWVKWSEIRMIPRPNLFSDCQIIFKVLARGISSHKRMNFYAILSIFCFTQVIERLLTVRCQLILESTYLWCDKILVFGWRGNLFTVFRSSFVFDKMSFYSLFVILKSKYWPKYTNDSSIFTELISLFVQIELWFYLYTPRLTFLHPKWVTFVNFYNHVTPHALSVESV